MLCSGTHEIRGRDERRSIAWTNSVLEVAVNDDIWLAPKTSEFNLRGSPSLYSPPHPVLVDTDICTRHADGTYRCLVSARSLQTPFTDRPTPKLVYLPQNGVIYSKNDAVNASSVLPNGVPAEPTHVEFFSDDMK